VAISYYAKKRLSDLGINIVMFALLAVTLTPIVWMVYSSVKDSTDIAIGKIGLRRASTDIISIVPQKDNLMALSANGGITIFRAKDLAKINSSVYKTTATTYFVDENYIWISSANRGIIRVNKQAIDKCVVQPIETGNIDTNKVTSTLITKKDNKVYASLDYRGFQGVWEINPSTGKLLRYHRGKKKEIFAGIKDNPITAFKGVDGEVFCRFEANGFAYMGASGGKLYKYDLISNKIVGMEKVEKGHLLVRWHNYVDMWKNVNFGLYLRNSIIICGFTMLFSMIFATFAAYALSRFKFPGADLFSNATLATQMIPMIMYLIPIYIMFVKFTAFTGIPVKGTFPGIILIYSAWFLPFSIWILRGFFAAIPKELEEAALIDGCSRLKVFWHVALPLAMPGIVATGIYTFLNAWDELMFAWVLTSADTMTIPVGIRLFVGNYQNRFDLMMAAATVATIPVVVLFFLLQRHIVKGLTAGAVKG